MDPLKRIALWLPLILSLTGCQMLTYVTKSGYGQLKLLSQRTPIEEVLENPELAPEKRAKLLLAQEARSFAENTLHLKPTKNYKTYVELDRPYVTYVVSAAEPWNLKIHNFSYPFLGKMPYKGYFNEEDAKDEEKRLQSENLDTYLRGVSAYSTLGWFNDPLLSSMLRYKEYDLVNTIIHETVHATLYIKNAADFNEQLATFLGNKGMELFYLQKEGPDSETLKTVQDENHDSRVFSEFISEEIKALKEWYTQLPQEQRLQEVKDKRLREIQLRFVQNVKAKMKTSNYDQFENLKLNNARILIYRTYVEDLSRFEKLYDLMGRDFQKFINKCRELEKAQDPEQELASWIR